MWMIFSLPTTRAIKKLTSNEFDAGSLLVHRYSTLGVGRPTESGELIA
jgi:hypothetical protein